jgi:hypothetical protein
MRVACLLLVALFAGSGRLQAQRLVSGRFAPAPAPAAHATATTALSSRPRRAAGSVDSGSVDVPKLALGGVIGGTAGMFAGAIVGHRFESSPCEDCFWAALYGALVGESIGSALGVHLANDRRGPALAEMALSLGIGTVGLAAAARGNSGAILLAIPVTQIASAIALER